MLEATHGTGNRAMAPQEEGHDDLQHIRRQGTGQCQQGLHCWWLLGTCWRWQDMQNSSACETAIRRQECSPWQLARCGQHRQQMLISAPRSCGSRPAREVCQQGLSSACMRHCTCDDALQDIM